jgi:hypothetical protein
MPSGAVANPPWATGTWEDTAWEADSWGLTEGETPVRVVAATAWRTNTVDGNAWRTNTVDATAWVEEP